MITAGHSPYRYSTFEDSDMQPLRRTFLRGSAASLLLPLLGTGLLRPGAVQAAPWQRDAFSATSTGAGLKALNIPLLSETRDIIVNAPEIAENGAKVDIEISSNLANTRSLLLFADKNPLPLCAELEFGDNALPYAKIQIKLAESMRIRAVARTADGKNHVAFRDIKVTLSGC